jgi:dCTP deaminase
MILKADIIAERLREGLSGAKDPLILTPTPDLAKLRDSGAASVDLRLGTWFVTLRRARMRCLSIGENTPEAQLCKTQYVPFGSDYILHPRCFVLAASLEWMRVPSDLAAYVIGKSSWGRRGLIIATAAGVHPGFVGSLTLELTNVGEIPIAITPGTTICQLCFHTVDTSGSERLDQSRFIGLRKPELGNISLDDFARSLADAYGGEGRESREGVDRTKC